MKSTKPGRATKVITLNDGVEIRIRRLGSVLSNTVMFCIAEASGAGFGDAKDRKQAAENAEATAVANPINSLKIQILANCAVFGVALCDENFVLSASPHDIRDSDPTSWLNFALAVYGEVSESDALSMADVELIAEAALDKSRAGVEAAKNG